MARASRPARALIVAQASEPALCGAGLPACPVHFVQVVGQAGRPAPHSVSTRSLGGLRYALLLLVCAAASAKDRIAYIEFFGYQGLNPEAVRAALPFHEGDAMRPGLQSQARATVKRITGRDATDVAAICCLNDGDTAIFIGLPGASSHLLSLNPRPSGNARLSAELMDLYQAMEDAELAATDMNEVSPPAGYRLMKDARARAAELKLREYSLRHADELIRVLANSADREQRAIAADALGFANRSTEQLTALVSAVRDPDDNVRNNATRALSEILQAEPASAPRIPPGPFLDLIRSGTWTDRNKGSLVLEALTQSATPQALERIRSQAWDALLEMSNWRPSGWSFAPRAIVSRILAPTPPMGWNSWDSFGTGVTEAEVKANADYMAAHLARYGWHYIVVDIQWSEPNPKTHGYRPNAELVMDANGRLMPAPNRFPSAADGRGFKPLADYVHSKGLKFGIHIMRGIPRRAVDQNLPIAGSPYKAGDVANRQSICRWNTDMYGIDVTRPGGQDYYDSVASLYAAWGVDFIKADDMLAAPGGDHTTEIAALSLALRKTGRPIVLSLSPGTRTTNNAAELAVDAQMWRISDDFWDRWIDLKRQFPNFTKWNPWVRLGNWPDGDMLPLGHIGIRAERGEPRMSLLTPHEQRTLMTLWSIARSPLMFGGHLPDNDDWTLGLLTNEEVLAVNQKASQSRELFTRENQVAWIAELPGSDAKYLAVFNTGDTNEEEIKVAWSELGLSGACAVRDLWARKDLGRVADGQTFRVGPHASAFFKITR